MIEPNNAASIRVAHRLDLLPLRNDVLLDRKVVVYAMSRDEWSPAQSMR